jgi:DNA gyrase subunit B
MCAKKVRNEIDSLRGDVQSLSEAVWALRDHVTVQSVAAAAANGMSSKPEARAMASDLAGRAGSDPAQGIVSTRGYVLDGNGSREYRWDLERKASDLLAVDEDLVARMLAAVGHKQRLLMLKAILDKPSSAAELVSSLNLGTTGAAYHHLNVLQAADLVTQEGRGMFIVQPHRVSAIFAILAGVESATDTTYTDHAPVSDTPDEPGDPESAESLDAVDGASTGGKRKKRKGT